MNLPEFYTTNCEAWREYWDSEEEAIRFICPICGELWPDQAIYYFIDKAQRPICKKHRAFHETYNILNEFEDEVFGSDFNAITVTLKLKKEGII